MQQRHQHVDGLIDDLTRGYHQPKYAWRGQSCDHVLQGIDRLYAGQCGALTRLPGGEAVLADVRAKGGGGERLLPPPDARVALDRDYVFACCGALLQHFAPEAVTALLRASTRV